MSILDLATVLFDTAEYRIAVIDINEPPVLQNVNLNVAENSMDDTAVGAPLLATDDDLKRPGSAVAACTGSCQSLDYQIITQSPCLDPSNSDAGACFAFKIDRCSGKRLEECSLQPRRGSQKPHNPLLFPACSPSLLLSPAGEQIA